MVDAGRFTPAVIYLFLLEFYYFSPIFLMSYYLFGIFVRRAVFFGVKIDAYTRRLNQVGFLNQTGVFYGQCLKVMY